MKKITISLVIVLTLVLTLISCQNSAPLSPDSSNTPSNQLPIPVKPQAIQETHTQGNIQTIDLYPHGKTPPPIKPTGETKEFNIVAKKWEFNPSTIIVKRGDKVKITLLSSDISHGFAIPEYNINQEINPGKTTTVEFFADKVGTFSFYCSIPCGKSHLQMIGQLIVE